MLRTRCLAMTLFALPLGTASADAGPDLGANAALKYWQAFATLPKLTDAEQNKLAAEYLTMPLDAHARELVTKAEYALQMMRYGAALRRCDWGIGYEEGIATRLPYGPAARVLSALACLRARLRFEAGQSTAALDDLVAALTLGRHVSRDGGLVMMLVGYAIEHRVSEMLALDLPRLEAKTLKNLQMRLDALPPGGRPAQAMQFEEKSAVDWFGRQVKEAKDKEGLLALLSMLVDSEGAGRDRREKGRAFLEECGGTAESVLKFLEELRPSYALMATKLDLPLDQFEKEFQREAMKRAGNPVFKRLFPPFPSVRRRQAQAEVRRALVSAAIAVQLDGRDALQQHPDPVIGGVFEYVAFAGGFELRSQLKGQDNKPLALTVGRRGN